MLDMIQSNKKTKIAKYNSCKVKVGFYNLHKKKIT